MIVIEQTLLITMWVAWCWMVEYMMGLPRGWTGLEPLETEWFREWLREHGISLMGEGGKKDVPA